MGAIEEAVGESLDERGGCGRTTAVAERTRP